MSTENGAVIPDAPVESAPTSEVVEETTTSVEETESGTVTEPESETTVETTETVLRDKGVEELVKTRKRAQEAEEKARKLEQEAAYLKGRLDGIDPKGEQKPTAPVIPQGPPPRPNLDDFDTYEDFEAADKKHTVAMAKWEFQQEAIARARSAEVAKVSATFAEKLKKEAEVNPDLIRIAGDQTLPINPFMSQTIRTSEVGIQILQHLDKNRDLAVKINAMNPVNAAREFGKLEAMLANQPKPEPPARISQAPAPVKTVTAKGTPTVADEDLPIEEFMARRNQQQFSRSK